MPVKKSQKQQPVKRNEHRIVQFDCPSNTDIVLKVMNKFHLRMVLEDQQQLQEIFQPIFMVRSAGNFPSKKNGQNDRIRYQYIQAKCKFCPSYLTFRKEPGKNNSFFNLIKYDLHHRHRGKSAISRKLDSFTNQVQEFIRARYLKYSPIELKHKVVASNYFGVKRLSTFYSVGKKLYFQSLKLLKKEIQDEGNITRFINTKEDFYKLLATDDQSQATQIMKQTVVDDPYISIIISQKMFMNYQQCGQKVYMFEFRSNVCHRKGSHKYSTPQMLWQTRKIRYWTTVLLVGESWDGSPSVFSIGTFANLNVFTYFYYLHEFLKIVKVHPCTIQTNFKPDIADAINMLRKNCGFQGVHKINQSKTLFHLKKSLLRMKNQQQKKTKKKPGKPVKIQAPAPNVKLVKQQPETAQQNPFHLDNVKKKELFIKKQELLQRTKKYDLMLAFQEAIQTPSQEYFENLILQMVRATKKQSQRKLIYEFLCDSSILCNSQICKDTYTGFSQPLNTAKFHAYKQIVEGNRNTWIDKFNYSYGLRRLLYHATRGRALDFVETHKRINFGKILGFQEFEELKYILDQCVLSPLVQSYIDSLSLRIEQEIQQSDSRKKMHNFENICIDYRVRQPGGDVYLVCCPMDNKLNLARVNERKIFKCMCKLRNHTGIPCKHEIKLIKHKKAYIRDHLDRRWIDREALKNIRQIMKIEVNDDDEEGQEQQGQSMNQQVSEFDQFNLRGKSKWFGGVVKNQVVVKKGKQFYKGIQTRRALSLGQREQQIEQKIQEQR